MKKKVTLVLSFHIILGMFGVSDAYELLTHGEITNAAYTRSNLGQSATVLARLGLDDLPTPFGAYYYDFSTTDVRFRFATPFEVSKMNRDFRPNNLRIRGWLMRGAIREDDGGFLAGVKAGEPLDDPYGNINRFCNHFLDPITRNAQTSSLLDVGAQLFCPNGSNVNAANWALGTNAGGADAFSASPLAVDNFRNHFSIPSAREAMWRALTLTQKDGTTAPRPIVLYQNPSWRKEDDRKAYWATAFRALGDALHLNQDMAQPQHTRNEGHGISPANLIETYVDARASGAIDFKFDGEGKLLAELGDLPPLPLNANYPIPRLSRYSDYWSTEQGSASILAGQGLADYSSRSFFTPAKILGANYNGFPAPTNNEATYTIETEPFQQFPTGCNGQVGRNQYAKGNLPDDFLIQNDPTVKIKYASRSLVAGKWTLNRCVFDERVDLLIPRAVAYSAGLIDYFFRGQLEVTPTDEGVYSVIDHNDRSGANAMATDAANGFKGFKTFRLKLRNATPDITPAGSGPPATPIPQTMSGGKLVGVLKFYRNLAHTDDLAGEPANETVYGMTRSPAEEIVVSSRVKDGAGMLLTAPISVTTTAQTFQFEFDQELPINAIDIKLQVVYRGVLGSESDAVVVETVDISEPSYVTYLNTTDYIQLGNSFYTRGDVNMSPALLSQVRPTTLIDNMTGQLKNTSLVPIPLSFIAKIGNATSNASVGVNLLNDKTYHRLAMLIPPGATGTINWILASSGCGYNSLLDVPRRVVQTDYTTEFPAGFTLVSPLLTTRGTNSLVSVSCILNGDNLPHPELLTETQNASLATLQGANLKPLPFSSFTFGTP